MNSAVNKRVPPCLEVKSEYWSLAINCKSICMSDKKAQLLLTACAYLVPLLYDSVATTTLNK